MKKTWWRNVGAVALAALLPAAMAQTDPGAGVKQEETAESVEAAMAEAGKGDLKLFTVSTGDDTTALAVGDVYKSNSTYFKVTRVRSSGPKGGRFIVQRVSGRQAPLPVWERVTGVGPLAIQSNETLLQRYLSGGSLMHPIAFLLLVAIVLAFNNLWVYRRSKQCPPEFIAQAREALEAGDLGRFGSLAAAGQGLLAAICRPMTREFETSSLEDIQVRCEAAARRQTSLLRVPLRILNFTAAVSPLLGLLGTVVGMIVCFGSLAGEVASASKAQVMAAGIKVALLTTAAGLMVAIPALALFFAFSQRLNSIVADCEDTAMEFLHRLARIKRGGTAPAGEVLP